MALCLPSLPALHHVNKSTEPLINWQRSRGRFLVPMQAERRKLIGDGVGQLVCEHIVIYNKRDLVPEWGVEVTISTYKQRQS